MGRRKIELDLDKVAELAGLGLYHWQIAQALGISADTLERRMKEDAPLEQAVRQARLGLLREVAAAVLEKARQGNLQAQLFLLRSFSKRKEQAEVRSLDAFLSVLSLKGEPFSGQCEEMEALWDLEGREEDLM